MQRERTVNAAKPLVPLGSHSYLYVTLFTISAQATGLVAAYLLGIIFYYDSLIKTHCTVSIIACRQHIALCTV